MPRSDTKNGIRTMMLEFIITLFSIMLSSACYRIYICILAPARISSFGGIAVGAAGGSLSLRCVVGGVPPPAKRWLRAGNQLHPRSPFQLDGDALLIRSEFMFSVPHFIC